MYVLCMYVYIYVCMYMKSFDNLGSMYVYIYVDMKTIDACIYNVTMYNYMFVCMKLQDNVYMYVCISKKVVDNLASISLVHDF